MKITITLKFDKIFANIPDGQTAKTVIRTPPADA